FTKTCSIVSTTCEKNITYEGTDSAMLYNSLALPYQENVFVGDICSNARLKYRTVKALICNFVYNMRNFKTFSIIKAPGKNHLSMMVRRIVDPGNIHIGSMGHYLRMSIGCRIIAQVSCLLKTCSIINTSGEGDSICCVMPYHIYIISIRNNLRIAV